MKRLSLPIVRLAAATLAVSGTTWGQPAPATPEPAPAAPGAPAPTAPTPTAPTDSSLEGYAPPGPPASEADDADAAPPAPDETVVDPAAAEDPPPAPPLGPPVASEQGPKPVLAAESRQPSRRVHLGFYAGVSHRSSESDRVTYDPSFAFGPSAGVELWRWLRAEAYARFESFPVQLRAGAFDTGEYNYPETTFAQPALDATGLGFRLLPTWMVLDRLGVQASFDVMWTRFTATAPSSSGATVVRSAERAGVGLNYKLGLGVVAEPIPDWLELAATGSYGIFTGQTGSAFEVLQAFDQTGHIVHLAPLPRFQNSLELLFTVALIL
ncbi:MAG TPA: hypothetical protein VI197_15035 [Polyangiaceae bacterium]